MTNFIAMGDVSTQMSAQFMYTTALVLFMGLVMPVVAIAVIIKKSQSPEVLEKALGLGNVSLHEELNEFIAAVESGDISLHSLNNESARPVAAPHTTTNSPGV